MSDLELKDKIVKRLTNPDVFTSIGEHLRKCLSSPKVYIVTIEEETSGKTHAQLRGIFGVWAKEVSARTGETIDDIHNEWKHHFLVNVYRENPRPGKQQDWLDVIYELEEMQRFDVVEKYIKTISLSLASVAQAKDYMNRIEQHYISAGIPLQPLDKDWDKY